MNFLIAVCSCLLLTVSSFTLANASGQIYYETLLKDATGTVIHGDFDVEFIIYDSAVGGDALWREMYCKTENSSLFVDSGRIGVLLGSINPIPDSVVRKDGRWLGIQIGLTPELTPREALVKGAYSYKFTDRRAFRKGQPVRKLCSWRDRWRPDCRRFPISECGLYVVGFSSVKRNSTVSTGHVAADIGSMWSLSKNSGLGATVHVVLGEEARIGPKLRYRRWLNDEFALDISSGVTWNVLRRNVQNDVQGKAGYASSIGINFRDELMFQVKLDVFPFWDWLSSERMGARKTQKDFCIGLTAGSKAGMIGIVGTAVIVFLAIFFPPF